MKLTPIKVRGKRGVHKPAWKPPNPEQFKRKRTQEEESEEEEEEGKQENEDGSQPRRRRRVKTKKPAARIEQLPVEILERISLVSENLNFPRSSLRIGYYLSHASFLSELIVDAFAPTWDVWFGCPKGQIQSYHGYAQDHARIGGNPKFQTAVLACPWVSISLILNAQQKWYRRHGAARYFEHSEDWRACYGACCTDEDDLVPDHGPHVFGAGGADHGRDVKACFEADWGAFSNKDHGFTLIFSYLEHREMHKAGYFDMHPLTRIPNHLLTGPLDWDKAKWLYWCIRGGAQLSPDQNWEVTKRGYEQILALALDDAKLAMRFLYLFAILDVFGGKHWPQFLIDEKLHEARKYFPRPSDSLPADRWEFRRAVWFFLDPSHRNPDRSWDLSGLYR
ncbi:hypothetical protein B0T22DRAFT_451426 [Podospora appendiculata]|uniref:Uncharacterized protein n=1 Tax=Podospora appendiculata TaxID=314037 RepID=A0AAE0XID4_9PEZI|nr:hypothetical protein B0T22DRAFT_451426 [Podospora appendiculata]